VHNLGVLNEKRVVTKQSLAVFKVYLILLTTCENMYVNERV
jgi:hypothetical protein